MKKSFRLIGCGGTFDLFHKGHAKFLEYGLSQADRLLIGIATDAYAADRKWHMVESYDLRKKGVEDFLETSNLTERVAILPLDSIYIPKEWEDMPIEAILATPDSLSGAEEVNRKRREDGKSQLVIIQSPLCLSEDGEPISSSRIREGKIDREGKRWIPDEWYQKTFFLPNVLRNTLSVPFGEMIDAKTYAFSRQEKESLIAVGDVTTMLLHSRNIIPKLNVIDLIVERERRFHTIEEMGLKTVNLTYTVQNTPGQISFEVFQRVYDAFKQIKEGKTVLLHVVGEEDLTVLPILLQAPIGWVLCYGQPKKGTVKVVITEGTKKRTKAILEKFTIR